MSFRRIGGVPSLAAILKTSASLQGNTISSKLRKTKNKLDFGTCSLQRPVMSAAAMEQREQLRHHFSSIPAKEQTAGWDEMWQRKITPWDRSMSNPALIDTLEQRAATLGPAVNGTERKRALVPGCGGGYDVLLLASFGYDAVGIDAAPSAIEKCKALAAREAQAETKQYPIKHAEVGAGKAEYLVADFFGNDYLPGKHKKFDLIYDYTFLCALPPELRPAWAKKMSDLLSATGILICLEFPLAKPAASGGPPHGLSEQLYLELFKQPGEEIEYGSDQFAVATGREASASGLKRVDRWVPERSHQAGQGTDSVSLWRHATS